MDEGLGEIELGFRDLLQDFNGNRWAAATLTLSNAGQMSIDFDYYDAADFYQAPAERNAWISRYLGG